ncbi:hypothetical protein GTY75_20910 [Streptomyces sp. SID8381]|uniref:hypothetical protein n=1 Tax=unclassified Streptomyces TaxID=2593676 RepID=UPI0013715EE4|nr:MULTISPECIES: hypothetical protein [unclassified Streptomyces]MYX29062.1 hypothetical protein [Streptomyces sp. SID8381]
MSVMALEVEDSTDVLDLDFEMTVSSIFAGDIAAMEKGPPLGTQNICCISARTHSSC